MLRSIAISAAIAALAAAPSCSNPQSPSNSPTPPAPSSPPPPPSAPSAPSGQLAFPAAEGFGRFAKGGRGGVVHQVTNLQDSGPGSLRACIEASGPRTCVFRIGGAINLNASLVIENPFITIAGQTAPGGGIALRNNLQINAPLRINAHDVIIRHIRMRPGPSIPDSDNVDAVRVSGVGSLAETENITDIIFDHITLSWSTDELFDHSPWADRVTLQDSFVYEGLHDSTHTQGKHSKGPNLRSCGVSIIRTLIANSAIRNPNNTCGIFGSSMRGGGGVTGENEFRNNVVFNGQEGFFDYFNGRGDSEVNIACNVFIRGPSTHENNLAPYAVDARDVTSAYFDHGLAQGSPGFVPAGASDAQRLCLQDNMTEGFPGDAGAPTARPAAIHGVLDPRDAHIVASTDCVNNPVGNPDAAGGVRGLTGPLLPSAQVLDAVLNNSGAMPWNRDAADARIAADVAARQGAIIDDPSQVGGWPALAAGTPAADSDQDGMLDSWETQFGLNPNDASDRNDDQDGDDFTNLEEYLNDAAGDQNGMG
jgi:hypothetical protein